MHTVPVFDIDTSGQKQSRAAVRPVSQSQSPEQRLDSDLTASDRLSGKENQPTSSKV